jgi:hypothetical protein
MRPPFEALQPD